MAYIISNFAILTPADEMKIERTISFNDKNVDISRLTALSAERLEAMRRESAAAERAIYENLQEATEDLLNEQFEL